MILDAIQATLAEAEERQLAQTFFKLWLSAFKDAAYEIEDVLDDLDYGARWKSFKQENKIKEVAKWGRMSMCDAKNHLLANALLDLSNVCFVLLSESCIPLYNFSIIYRYLQRSHFCYMGAFDDKGPHGKELESNLLEKEKSFDKFRSKETVEKKRAEEWRKILDKDLEKDDECDIYIEICTKMDGLRHVFASRIADIKDSLV